MDGIAKDRTGAKEILKDRNFDNVKLKFKRERLAEAANFELNFVLLWYNSNSIVFSLVLSLTKERR